MKTMSMMLCIAALVLCGCSSRDPHGSSAENPVILDVRTPEEYQRSHLESAINLPHTEVEEKIEKLIPGKDTEIILYCRSGNRTGMTVKILKKLGYSRIRDLGAMQNAQKETGKKIVP